MRILLVSRAFTPAVGGIERFAESLAGWLARRGHVVIVVTRTETDGREPEWPYRVVRRPSAERVLALARSADVVHANGLSLRGVGLGLVSRRPTVVTHHGHQAVCPTGLCMPRQGACTAGPPLGPCGGCPERGLKGAGDVRLHDAASRTVAENVAVSDYLSSRLRLPRSRMIYSPVSAEAFAAATDSAGGDGLVVFAGRLVSEKGLDLLVRAIALVPDARLEVVGDGPMLRDFRGLVDELGLSVRVSFLGSQPFAGVADAYRRASVVCVPSLWDEPFGFVAAEAMAMQRPLVVTPSGALSELCADRRGFVAGDRTATALASSLTEALADEEERARRAASAREFAKRALSADRAGLAYESLYEEVVA